MVPNPNVCSIHHTVLPDVSILHSTASCAAPGPDMSVLRHSVLSLDVSVQQQLIVFLEVSVLQKPLLPCTYLFYNNLCWPLILNVSVQQQPELSLEVTGPQAACAAPGRVFLREPACAVLHLDVSVYESLCCAAPGRICLREPVLCCTWTYLSTRACTVLNLDVSG